MEKIKKENIILHIHTYKLRWRYLDMGTNSTHTHTTVATVHQDQFIR